MIKRIVLTGGPGTGKTTVLKKIQEEIPKMGYKVMVVDETATYLITHGIKPFGENAVDMVDFQELMMRLQLAKEEVFDLAAKMCPNENILIVYDRGTIDNSAYVKENEFDDILKRLNRDITILTLMNHYDSVIALMGKEAFYTTENNAARSEDVKEALKLGETTLQKWVGHPKINIVLPKETIEEKIEEVLDTIRNIIKEKPVKKQRKYLVDLSKTDMKAIEKLGKKVEIEQAYLISEESHEKRVRKIAFNHNTSYSLSVYKICADNSKIVVSEKEISEATYENLLEFRDKSSKIIRKTRYYFKNEGDYFRLDIIENNSNVGILEVDEIKEDQIHIPSYAFVIEDVTHEARYYNHSLALDKNLIQVLNR